MLGLKQVHHIAIIATDYAVSKAFYCDILGFDLLSEVWREERDSWKGDLALNGQYVIELFSFPFPPARPSRPEACGLRHLAFSVENVETPLRIWKSIRLSANRYASIRIPGSALLFSTIRTVYRLSCMSSKACH